MRKELTYFLDKKITVKNATVERYGLKKEYIGGSSITILFKDLLISDDIKEITVDHAWLSCGKWFEEANLHAGSVITMNCHVKPYEKGYVNYREMIDDRTIDIGLQRASKISSISTGDGTCLKTFLKEQRKNGHFISNKYA